MKLVVDAQIILLACDIVHGFPCLLTRFIPWCRNQPIFGHFIACWINLPKKIKSKIHKIAFNYYSNKIVLLSKHRLSVDEITIIYSNKNQITIIGNMKCHKNLCLRNVVFVDPNIVSLCGRRMRLFVTNREYVPTKNRRRIEMNFLSFRR